MTRACLGVLVLSVAAGPLAAQDRRCVMQVDHVERQGVSTKILGTNTTNYFAGGDVRMSCRGQPVKIWSDSVASYASQVVQFIGNFKYQDETARVTSDFGTYYKDDERWEATGNVHYLNLQDSSRLDGPMAVYRRKLKGTRDLEEIYAEQRPTLTLAARDSARKAEEPYIVVGDRIRMRGRDLMWAGGNVTIDRSDLKGRGDSLQLDNGKASAGAIIGKASIRRQAEDSFALTGKRIDLALSRRELTAVTGRDSATLTSKDLDLVAEAIRLRLEARKVVQTLAWGTTPVTHALSDDYEVRGDSIAVDTPAEQLKEMRAFRKGWVGFKPDSSKGERDWLAGDTVVAYFVPRDTPTGKKSALERLEARKQAKSFYRITGTGNTTGRPSINYAGADTITLYMLVGDSTKIDRVVMHGNVNGMQLQPKTVNADSLKADSVAKAKATKPQ